MVFFKDFKNKNKKQKPENYSEINKINNSSWSSGYYGDFALFKFYGDYMYFPNFVDYQPTNSNKIIQTNLDGTIKQDPWALSYNPEGCIVHQGYLYVTNAYDASSVEISNSISKISLTNPTIDNNHQWVRYDQGLDSPVGLVTDGTYLYVTNFNNDTISRASLTDPSGDFIPDWATSVQGLSAPTGIVLNGNFLYVANSHGDTISKISLTDPSGSSIPYWVEGLSYPVGIAIYCGYLYVSNASTNTINKILLNDTSQNDSTWAQGLHTPVGIDIYNNYLYVYNNGAGTISQISLPECNKIEVKVKFEALSYTTNDTNKIKDANDFIYSASSSSSANGYDLTNVLKNAFQDIILPISKNLPPNLNPEITTPVTVIIDAIVKLMITLPNGNSIIETKIEFPIDNKQLPPFKWDETIDTKRLTSTSTANITAFTSLIVILYKLIPELVEQLIGLQNI